MFGVTEKHTVLIINLLLEIKEANTAVWCAVITISFHYFIQLALFFSLGSILALLAPLIICEVQTLLGITGSLGICWFLCAAV